MKKLGWQETQNTIGKNYRRSDQPTRQRSQTEIGRQQKDQTQKNCWWDECSFIFTFECFKSITGAHADETEENSGTRTTTATYRNGDWFRIAKGPTADIDSNRDVTYPTETKGSH